MKSTTSNIERLLAIAEAPANPLDDPKLNEAERFVIAKDLKEGNEKVLAMIVYELYRTWRKHPLAKNKFFSQFNRIFTQYKNDGSLFYRLDGAAFDLTQDYYFALRRRVRDARTRRGRKKDETKPS